MSNFTSASDSARKSAQSMAEDVEDIDCFPAATRNEKLRGQDLGNEEDPVMRHLDKSSEGRKVRFNK